MVLSELVHVLADNARPFGESPVKNVTSLSHIPVTGPLKMISRRAIDLYPHIGRKHM